MNERVIALRDAVKREADELARRRHLARVLSGTVHIGEISGRLYVRGN